MSCSTYHTHSVVLVSVSQTQVENEELRENLSEVTAQHNSVLEENQRLCAKLENLEQVLKVQLWSDLSVLLYSFQSLQHLNKK